MKIDNEVAAVVTGVLENVNLLISGSQEVRVNHELRILNVAGIVRPQDVDADNEIEDAEPAHLEAGCNVLLRAMLAAAGVVQAADGGVPA